MNGCEGSLILKSDNLRENPEPQIVVALDFPCAEQALRLVDQLDPGRCRLKVGKELFVAAGPELIRQLVNRGFRVFLDLKFHDIPNTVAGACRSAVDLGVWMLSVHILGGGGMLAAARRAVDLGSTSPLLVGVTVLTSHDAKALREIGIAGDPSAAVERLAGLAQRHGLDGVVCSAREASVLRARLGKRFRLVVPGIRPSGAPGDDQRRVVSPTEAVAAGADFLVVGRPITQAPDPLSALDALEGEIHAASGGLNH